MRSRGAPLRPGPDGAAVRARREYRTGADRLSIRQRLRSRRRPRCGEIPLASSRLTRAGPPDRKPDCLSGQPTGEEGDAWRAHRRRTAARGVRLQAGASTRPAPVDQLGDRLRLHLADRRPLHRRRARRRDGRARVGVERADRHRRPAARRARLRAARRRWPIAGGIYQWSRRLVGPRYGWWAGWIYIWALILTLSTVAYGGGGFLGQLVGIDVPTTGAVDPAGAGDDAASRRRVNVVGLQLLRYTVNIGIACEAVASVGIGIALILFFRQQPVSVLTDTGGVAGGGSYFPAFIAAVAIAGWVLLGFDACGSVAEETRDAARAGPQGDRDVDPVRRPRRPHRRVRARARQPGPRGDGLGRADRTGVGGGRRGLGSWARRRSSSWS